MPGYRNLCCSKCGWITQRDGLLPKHCDNPKCAFPFPAAALTPINHPFGQDLPATGQKRGGPPTSPPTQPRSRPESSHAQSAQASNNQRGGRHNRWGNRSPPPPQGRYRPDNSAPASSQQHRQPRRSSSAQPPLNDAPDNSKKKEERSPQSQSAESQDSLHSDLSQQPMHQDGDAKSHRAALVAKINRYQQMIAVLHPTEDDHFLQKCHGIIHATKQEIIQLNSPQDQLRNLQAAQARKASVEAALLAEIAEKQALLATVQDEIADNMLREKQLMAIVTTSHGCDLTLPGADLPTTEQFMQVQGQLAALHSQFCLEKQQWNQQLQMLHAVPNMPEDAVKLLPILQPQAQTAPPTPGAAPESPLAEPQRRNPEPPLTGYEAFNDSDDADVEYGPGGTLAPSLQWQRSTPYGPAPVDSVQAAALASSPFLEEIQDATPAS